MTKTLLGNVIETGLTSIFGVGLVAMLSMSMNAIDGVTKGPSQDFAPAASWQQNPLGINTLNHHIRNGSAHLAERLNVPGAGRR